MKQLARPLIAIVGSADATRTYDPPMQQFDVAHRACEQIGRELAAKNCRMLVYSSDPQFIEAHVVRGYASFGRAESKSIQVRAPFGTSSGIFNEYDEHPDLFDARPDSSKDWQVSFYRSLVETDGVILIGGGSSTFVTGLVALAFKIPVVAVASFGGEAERVWQALDRVRNDAHDDEISTMASAWTAGSAKKIVDSVLQQRQRQEEQRRRAEKENESYRRRAARSLTIAALFLIFGLSIIPLVFALSPGTAGNIAALIATPLLVAPCGAIIRNVFDSREDWWRTAILGMVAGAISGLLFTLAQLAASPDLLEGDAARRLLLFLAVVGFIAGLTFDLVYSKLRAQDVVDTSALTAQHKLP